MPIKVEMAAVAEVAAEAETVTEAVMAMETEMVATNEEPIAEVEVAATTEEPLAEVEMAVKIEEPPAEIEMAAEAEMAMAKTEEPLAAVEVAVNAEFATASVEVAEAAITVKCKRSEQVESKQKEVVVVEREFAERTEAEEKGILLKVSSQTNTFYAISKRPFIAARRRRRSLPYARRKREANHNEQDVRRPADVDATVFGQQSV